MPETWFRNGIAAAAFIAALGVANHYCVTLPNQAKAEASDREFRLEARDSCLQAADDDYRRRWENTCESLGKATDCLLPGDTADSYDREHREGRDHCLRLYPR